MSLHPAQHFHVGADVAKDTITFCGSRATTVENRPAPLRAHLVCEATGRHHHTLQQAHARI